MLLIFGAGSKYIIISIALLPAAATNRNIGIGTSAQSQKIAYRHRSALLVNSDKTRKILQ